MFSELTVIVKDDDRIQKSKFGVYDTYTVDENDPILKAYIDQAIADFGSDPTEIQIRISMEVL